MPRSLRPLVIALAPGQQKYLDRIKDMRIGLANELSEIINEYGPKLYDDFNEVSATDTTLVVKAICVTNGPFTDPDTRTLC